MNSEEPVPAPVSILPTFKAGDRAWYGKAPCVIISDEGGSMVYIGFGSRHCFKPRGTLIPILHTKAKESTKRAVARGIERMAKSVPKTLEEQQRWELKLTMREIDTMEQLRILLHRLRMEVTLSPVITFGMAKMQVMGKIWSKMLAGEISTHQLRGKLDD